MTEIFSKEQAKASDRVHAELQANVYRAQANASSGVDRIHRAVNDDYKERYKSKSGWRLTDQEAFDLAVKLGEAADNDFGIDQASKAKLAVEAYRESRKTLDAAEATLREHAQEWINHGQWSRFFLVTAGHIHQSTACHTLYPTTQIGWLPELSGETEAEAVKAYGALLCTVCFPTAPVEWTDGRKADDDKYCPGTRPVPGSYNPRRRSPYGECATCGQTVSLTSLMNCRKHKKPA